MRHSSDNYKRLLDMNNIEKGNKKLSKCRHCIAIILANKVILFACIFGICSGIWNYVMYNYSILFDTYLIAKTDHQQNIQLAVLKSPIMWLVIFMWRWINAVTMIEFFVVAIFKAEHETLAIDSPDGR